MRLKNLKKHQIKHLRENVFPDKSYCSKLKKAKILARKLITDSFFEVVAKKMKQ